MIKKCKTCMHGYPSVSCVNCGTGLRNYRKYKPPTNADRIRGMSDEELAEILCISGWRMGDTSQCLDWLRQPAETEGTE